jgi:hypothetical protein
MSEVWALRLLRWSYCAFIASASLQTFLQARGDRDVHALILSSVEIAAIAAFLFAPLEVIACGVLLIVYAIAAALTVAVNHGLPLRFAYFAMTAIYIVIASRGRSISWPAQSHPR